MTQQTETQQDDPLFNHAVKAAWDSIPAGGVDDFTPEVLAGALRSALAVFDEHAENELDEIMSRVGFGGIDLDDGVKMRIKGAHEVMAHMVKAFDDVLNTAGADNYYEFEQTFTDPENDRRYRVLVIRPDRPSPHQLRMEAEGQRDELRALLRRFPPQIEVPEVCCEVAAEHKALGVDLPISVHEGDCPVVLADQPFLSLREALAGDDATWAEFINLPHIWNDPDRRTRRRIRWEPRDEPYAGMGGHLWRSDRGPYSFCHRPACRLVHLRWDWASPCPAAPAAEQVFGDAE